MLLNLKLLIRIDLTLKDNLNIQQFPETASFLKKCYFRMLLLKCLKRQWVKNVYVNVHFY